MRLPSFLCAGLQEFCAGSWISWEKLEPNRAPYLPVSYVPSSQRTYSGSASSRKPTLAQTSPRLSVKVTSSQIHTRSKDFNYILTRAHTHPSLKYAIDVTTQGSWHTSSPGHPPSLNNSTIWRQEVSCPSVHISCDWKYTLLDHVMEHHWTNALSLSPQKPLSNKSQTILNELCKPAAHSQNSVYMLTSYLCV